jgi:hypothetical protein
LTEPEFGIGRSVTAVRLAVGYWGVLRYPSSGVRRSTMNFDEIKNKAAELLEQNHEKVDEGIDKAAEFAAGKFGHDDQIKSVAEKAKDFLPGGQ